MNRLLSIKRSGWSRSAANFLGIWLPRWRLFEAMRSKRHPCARTTPITRRAIKEGFESDRARAARMGLNRKTIAKWRKRKTTHDAPHGPKNPHSLSLDAAEEDFVVHYRLLTQFTLDESLVRLREMFPMLSRSALHRCWKRHGVGRLRRDLTPHISAAAPAYISGHYFIAAHRDRSANRKEDAAAPALFSAVERQSGRAFCRRLCATSRDAAFFLSLMAADEQAPLKVAITEKNDPLFVAHKRETRPGEDKAKTFWHPFARVCRKKHIAHWLELPATAALAAALKPKQRRRRTRRKAEPPPTKTPARTRLDGDAG